MIIKVPMKWNFRLVFYSIILKSMILWFVIFEFGLRTSAYKFFLELQSWPIWVKMCDISRAFKICKLVRLTSYKVGKTFKPSYHLRGIRLRGPVLASCKTPLTQKALSYLYFRKTKSEEHIDSNLFGYGTGRTAKDECVRVVPPFRTKFLSTAFKQWRSSAMEMSQ